jgi:2-amino-4-hydroxy-6-hydroxymethyldihydropteridine diphosphokinase
MHIAFIGIGSNLGDREENCLQAIECLAREGVALKKRSSLYETEPWGVKDQPGFINLVVEIETERDPRRLLQLLKFIEKEMGREDTFRWGPRVIDLDILLYDDVILRDEDIQIPHPLMHLRDFVLKPMNEISPGLVHPLLKKSVNDLLAEVVSP